MPRGQTGLSVEGVGNDWRDHELEVGETVKGEVLRLPSPGDFNGNRIFLKTEDGVLSILATATRGHTLLERALAAKKIAVGDFVEIEFSGWAETQDTERKYRFEEVRRITSEKVVK
ncbi:MAG: hypothetical protein AABM43_01750 [Actinomycetota bacterium]